MLNDGLEITFVSNKENWNVLRLALTPVNLLLFLQFFLKLLKVIYVFWLRRRIIFLKLRKGGA